MNKPCTCNRKIQQTFLSVLIGAVVILGGCATTEIAEQQHILMKTLIEKYLFLTIPLTTMLLSLFQMRING